MMTGQEINIILATNFSDFMLIVNHSVIFKPLLIF